MAKHCGEDLYFKQDVVTIQNNIYTKSTLGRPNNARSDGH